MATFSINTGTSTESMAYSLVSGTAISPDYLNDILDLLEDNSSKQISPYVLRSALLSLYSSSPFKETTASGSTIDYVGIDNIDPTNRDLKRKIFIGKRAFSGTYSYSYTHDIMTSSLLNSDVDIFLYNTKLDSVDNDTTRISLLASTSSTLYEDSPYIQSQFVSGLSHSLSLDFVSINGDVNVQSDYNHVKINSYNLPTISESSASASNNKTLFYENGKLGWGDILLPSLNFIGTTGSSINIYGGPVNLNGFPLEFTDSRKVPQSVNGVSIGETFSVESLSDMIRRVVYPYLPPLCSISLLPPYESGYVEVGNFPTPILEFTIKKRTLQTQITTLSNMIPGVYPPVISYTPTTVTSTSNGIVISPITASTTTFTITVTDGTGSNSATTSLTGIYPFFYGFSSQANMTSIELSNLTKIVEPKSDKIIDISGNGNYYFIYDYDYGTLSNIYDSLGNTCSASFSATYSIFSSPTGLWAGKEFWVYKWGSVPQIGPPSQNFQFKF
jgi:hypothetical protein